MSPYRTKAAVPKGPALCGIPEVTGPCTDEVRPGHEHCCWHEHELHAIDEPWRGCGDPGCDCWP